MPRPRPLTPVLTASGALLLALLAPLVLADQALRVVTWNLETVGTPGSAPYQAVAAVLGRIRPSPGVPPGEDSATRGRHCVVPLTTSLGVVSVTT